jgi:alkanesulfonate monooxygenase SsuD/methylene tetrahydromethanopterin reductase-like flavin-dependent oxidoreductase (luciferase family)
VLVTAITHRHPILLGKMIATLDVISGGRAICGLGAGWDREEHLAYGIEFPPLRHRYALLEETLQMLPLLWGRGTPPFTGEHIRSPGLVCYPRPVQERIPILIGGGGEKRTLRLVAAYADACNLFGNPAKVAAKVAVLERHCTELDRDPADIEVTHLSTALVGADRSSLRQRVEQLRDRNTPAESFGAAANAGTVDDLESLFTAYSDAGTRHSIVAMPDVALEGSIETFGDVIARFNSS